ncbi:MAG: PIN domain-containing protein [Candidatus Kariarchaeaceae archaeon]|jgi:predicted nucleic acid-binding protein
MVERILLLDTSFILPVFGIDVSFTKNFRNEVKSLLNYGLTEYKLSISSISLIEVLFKLNREYRVQNDISILKRYATIVPTITHSSIFSIVHSHLIPKIVETSNEIRRFGHPDLFDCLIAATATEINGDFLTEDKTLIEVLETNEEKLGIRAIRWKEIKNYIISAKP